MKANELRIGNWIIISISSGLEQQVVDCMCDSINTKYHESIGFDFVEPVELTEDWLLRFGFKKVKTIHGSYYKNGFRFHTQRPGNTEGFLWNTETYYWDRDVLVKNGVKTVHRLQNLYFALTGEELTAEPTQIAQKNEFVIPVVSVSVCESPKDYICNVNDNGICRLPTSCVYKHTER